MIDTFTALLSLRPGAGLVMTGHDLSGVQWITENVTTPSQNEVDAEIVRLKKIETQNATAKENAKISAIQKLALLGLTPLEITAAFGIETEPEPTTEGRGALQVPKNVDNTVTLDTVEP